jgi:ADP-heptose:LPS heptosyltransferase
MQTPKKILAIKLRSLGDTVLMTGALEALRQAYPSAQIDLVVTDHWAGLFTQDPRVHRVYPYRRYQDVASRARAIAQLALKVRRENYDLVVNFHASPSSATLSFATGAKVRSVHFHGHRDKNRHSTVVVPGKGQVKPNIERDLDVVRALGIPIPEGKVLPKLRLPQELVENTRQEFWNFPEPLLGIGLGSSRPTKAWPIERFAAVARDWIQKSKGAVVVFVGSDEDALIELFKQHAEQLSVPSDRIVVRQGRPIQTLAAEIGCMSLFLGNDSGPRHLAVALQVPTVTLFGPEDPFEWHPYPTHQHPYFFVQGLACRKDADPGKPPWCGLDVCVTERHRCMTEISAEAVSTRVLEFL